LPFITFDLPVISGLTPNTLRQIQRSSAIAGGPACLAFKARLDDWLIAVSRRLSEFQ
jgi:hypothetical protein